jgi:TP53 regulating kinase and related kinases
MSEEVLIQQGAEAKIFQTIYDGKVAIRKERLSKSWRHRDLDVKLCKTRLKQEVNCLKKAIKHHFSVPSILFVNQDRFSIYMEYIPGETLKMALVGDKWDTFFRKNFHHPMSLSLLT